MNPKQLIEMAAWNYLQVQDIDLIALTSIYKGVENSYVTDSDQALPSTRKLPNVILEAEGDFEEVVLGTFNFRGTLLVKVQASGDAMTDATFNSLCKEVFSKFGLSTLVADLNSNTTEFYCYQARIAAIGTAILNGRNWENSLKLECVFAGKDL